MKVSNKHIGFILFGLALVMSLVFQRASHAFASTKQATTVLPSSAQRTLTTSRGYPPRWPLRLRKQEDNQVFQACADNTANKYYWGHDQGNSGNHGANSGYTEDDSSNETNQILIRSPFSHRRINQSFQICATDSANLHYFGVRQGNSGNNGYNVGQNEDNSSNLGNQIIG